ncbi:MAG: hypothetical protein HRT69_18395 [Flavobacteriaceae bacterium]|nr:hypothetical protein [Flavobacteriaceae bacterium]
MKKILVLLLMVIFAACINQKKEIVKKKAPTAEERIEYVELKSEAWNLYQSNEFLKSAKKYSEAFALLRYDSKTDDRYNAACSWALAKEIDSSFAQLLLISKKGNYINYDHITTDNDLSILHSDNRWERVINFVKINKEKAEEFLDKPLIAILDTIYHSDQSSREELDKISQIYDRKSKEIEVQWEKIHKIDSINLIKTKKILDERGWLGTEIIGNQGNITLFLIIQHSELETQEKYLPILREAVKKGKAKASHLALLDDRVSLSKRNKQIYGSQVGQDKKTGSPYVLPLIDPDNVDKRRADVGLGDMQSYLANYDMIWDLEEYKKSLPGYESK